MGLRSGWVHTSYLGGHHQSQPSVIRGGPNNLLFELIPFYLWAGFRLTFRILLVEQLSLVGWSIPIHEEEEWLGAIDFMNFIFSLKLRFLFALFDSLSCLPYLIC